MNARAAMIGIVIAGLKKKIVQVVQYVGVIMRLGQFKIGTDLLEEAPIQKLLNNMKIKLQKKVDVDTLFVAEFADFDEIDETKDDVPIYVMWFTRHEDGTESFSQAERKEDYASV